MSTDGPAPPSLLTDCGLRPFALPLGDAQFRWALAAAVPVWLALGLGVAGPLYRPSGVPGWLAFLLVLPLVEETVFRGLLQGQWLRLRGLHRVGGISTANWGTSALFAAMHALAQPPAWALAVVLPSLLFGHFRERHGSIWPGLALHALYNAGFALASLIAR